MVVYHQFKNIVYSFEERRAAPMKAIHAIIIVRISVLLLRRGLPFVRA